MNDELPGIVEEALFSTEFECLGGRIPIFSSVEEYKLLS